MDSSYRLNLEYRDRVHSEILNAVNEFEAGNLGVIEVSRKLSRYWTIVERERPDIAAALITFVGVDSETDALPIGPVRQLWDPTALEAEDRKFQQAEGYYRELVKRACDEIARLLA